jgi:polysaccharide deacetylase 2 family uncharacterized protein YibQ
MKSTKPESKSKKQKAKSSKSKANSGKSNIKTNSNQKSKSKKSTTKKTTKRKYTKRKKQKQSNKYIWIILAMISLVSIGYFWGVQSTKTPQSIPYHTTNDDEFLKHLSQHKPKAKKEKTKTKISKQNTKNLNTKRLTLNTNSKPNNQSSKLKIKNQKPKNLKANPKPKVNSNNKKPKIKKSKCLTPKSNNSPKSPKLVIIIDDVHTSKELSMIKSLPFSVTPSIFPPYKLAHNTPQLAKQCKHYMVHLPMESSSAKFNKQAKTIMRDWSKKQIEQRLHNIKKMFPNAKYINNHTGSVLTSNYHSMDMVYDALIKNGFIFVDSYTTPKSVVKKVAKKYHQRYIKRDVFIDNIQDVSYIKKQIQKGIKKAKKHGYSIIIGHPHKATIKALKESCTILKDVNVVYMDELFR